MDLNASGDHPPTPSPQTVFGLPPPPFSIGLPGKSSPARKRKPISSSSSGIPRANRNKGAAKSVIYGPSSLKHESLANINISQFKSPWVPAPGLATMTTTTTTSNTTQTNNRIKSSPRKNNKINNASIGSVPSFNTFQNGHQVDFLNDDTEGHSNDAASASGFPIHHRIKKSRKKSKSSSSRESRERSPSNDSTPQSVEGQDQTKKGKRSSYTLKSKDSLVDVTAFLTCKREEIMRLWEHYLAVGDHPELLIIFENANRLAAEAGSEVENLRQSILQLHEKETSLSEGDVELLDQLRERVLLKIKEFEQVNSKVQNGIVTFTATERQQSSVPTTARSQKSRSKSPEPAHPQKEAHNSSTLIPQAIKARYSKSMSSTDHHPQMSQQSEDELTFIKEISSTFPHLPSFSDSSTDLDARKEYQIETLIGQSSQPPPPLAKARFSKSNTTATTAPSSTTVACDLSKLTAMYNEVLELPPVSNTRMISYSSHDKDTDKTIRNKNVRFENAEFTKKETINKRDQQVDMLQSQLISLIQHLKINEGQILASRKQSLSNDNRHHDEDEDSSIDSSSDHQPSTTNTKNQKILKLQRKLNDAEIEMEELKLDLERVESDSNFKVRLLKSSFEDRLDNLEHLDFPSCSQIMELKLKEAMSMEKLKVAELEKAISGRDEEIGMLKSTCAKLREEMSQGESSREILQRKLMELEKINENLSRELSSKNEEIVKLSKKLSSTPTDSPDRTQSLLRKNNKFELKIDDLRDRLAKARKNAYIHQVTKEKMQSRLTLRQDELLSELEDSRARNRHLLSQIRHITTTYHELFPPGLFTRLKHQHQCQTRSENLLKKKKSSSSTPPVRRGGEDVVRTIATTQEHQKSFKITNSNSSPRSVKSNKSQKQTPEDVEAPILQTKTWVTGGHARQKVDNGGSQKCGPQVQESSSDEYTDDDDDDSQNGDGNGDGHKIEGNQGGAASTTISELEDPTES